MKKRCPRCGERKPYTEFYPRHREDGTIELRTYCRPCEREIQRERRRRQDSEVLRRQARERYRRRMANPEARERQRERWRRAKRKQLADPEGRERAYEQAKQYRRRVKADPERHKRMLENARLGYHRRTGSTRSYPHTWLYPDEAKLLPVEPFQVWLRERAEEEGGITALAVRIGVDEKTIRRYLERTEDIEDQVVDRILTAEGSTHLKELYPELYRNA